MPKLIWFKQKKAHNGIEPLAQVHNIMSVCKGHLIHAHIAYEIRLVSPRQGISAIEDIANRGETPPLKPKNREPNSYGNEPLSKQYGFESISDRESH